MEHLSSRLKRLLKEKGLTQSELAARASITQGAVSKYVRGASEPKSRELHAISKVLGVSMESWFTGLPLPVGAQDEGGIWKSRATNAERKLRNLRAAVTKVYKNMEDSNG